ncbi:MAG: hypothetical protein KME15_11005 [Drouetiella hepatica Uher 2000/2452]|jgi:hypothetical protein|uniref:Uncharacterized protein n=1 Tax=Drouetiella hepatica Uher 2000/2452 TaxID=904376 RepID=A0A951UMX2_9CYAN|nr:hypothetical protein [Drouetiella hepatica Uher 2000/2452]
MIPQDITQTLTALFGEAVRVNEPESWQIEGENLRLLVLLSEDQSWLRSLITIAPAQEAAPYLAQLLEANFDETQETRYALFQNLLWGVFHHSMATLTSEDFQAAIARLVTLHQQGLSDSFSRFAEAQVRQIIRAAKMQGQSLAATLQSLERFYEEGVMGDLDASAGDRSTVLSAWRYQLERLWDEESQDKSQDEA